MSEHFSLLNQTFTSSNYNKTSLTKSIIDERLA